MCLEGEIAVFSGLAGCRRRRALNGVGRPFGAETKPACPLWRVRPSRPLAGGKLYVQPELLVSGYKLTFLYGTDRMFSLFTRTGQLVRLTVSMIHDVR